MHGKMSQNSFCPFTMRKRQFMSIQFSMAWIVLFFFLSHTMSLAQGTLNRCCNSSSSLNRMENTQQRTCGGYPLSNIIVRYFQYTIFYIIFQTNSQKKNIANSRIFIQFKYHFFIRIPSYIFRNFCICFFVDGFSCC